MLFLAIVIGQISYYAPLLGSNKDRTRSTQTLVNSGLYWIEGFSKGNSFTSLYCVSKELNVPPLSVKCAIAQVRCFKKWKNSKCIISNLLRDITRCRSHEWDKESKIIADKLDKFPSKKAILNFYWDRDMAGKSIKAKAYNNNNFEKTREYLKLNYKYPEFSDGFRWVLRARCEYKFDARVAKAAKMIEEDCSERCPCCYRKNSNPRLEHWFSKCYLFREFRVKYFKDIEILYEIFYIISKYCPISNSNVDTVITDMNNIELSSDSDSSNEVYNINNINNRNNIVNNSRNSDSENRIINISDNENRIINISDSENRIINISVSENRIINISDSENRIINISDNENRIINISVSENRIINISDSENRIINISDNENRIINISDSENRIINISDSENRIINISDSENRIINISDSENRIINISDSENRIINISDNEKIIISLLLI